MKVAGVCGGLEFMGFIVASPSSLAARFRKSRNLRLEMQASAFERSPSCLVSWSQDLLLTEALGPIWVIRLQNTIDKSFKKDVPKKPKR